MHISLISLILKTCIHQLNTFQSNRQKKSGLYEGALWIFLFLFTQHFNSPFAKQRGVHFIVMVMGDVCRRIIVCIQFRRYEIVFNIHKHLIKAIHSSSFLTFNFCPIQKCLLFYVDPHFHLLSLF